MKKNFKFFALTALLAGMSMSAFAQEKATTVWRYTVSSDKATLIGFVADLPASGKEDVTIPNQVTDPANATKKYDVTAINADAFSVSNDKAKLKKLTIAATKLTEIPAALVQSCSNLTEIDLTGATGLTTIPEKAFMGTKIAALDLSRTKVNSILNWFGTTYSYKMSGGTYTQAEANAANVAYLISKGKTPVYTGETASTSAGEAFAGYNEINKYYQNHYEGAVKYGDAKPYTLETANAYNTTTFTNKTNCKKAGDPVYYTEDEVNAFNATLEGAMTAGEVLTAYKFSLFDAVTTLQGIHVEGDAITETEANIYNAQLPGAIATTTQKKDAEGNPLTYTDQTAYDYNYALYYGKTGGEGLAVIGNDSGENFASHKEAYDYNNAYIVPEADQKAIGDTNPDTQVATKYTDATAYVANRDAVKTIKSGDEVEIGDDKADVPVAALNNNTLTTVTLNATWTSIADKAFENCTALTSINFGTATAASQSIGEKALLGTALTELNFIGTKVKNVKANVFVINDDINSDETKGPKTNATLTTVKFNKIWTNVEAYTFADCTALATVEFEDRDIASASAPGSPVTFKVPFGLASGAGSAIGEFAFANTAIAAIVIPQALDASKSSNKDAIDENAFSGCDQLKSFTYMVDNETSTVYAVVNDLAFAGCKDVIYNTTNANVAKYMSLDKKAPKNSTFNITSGDGYVTPFTPIAYKNNPAKFYIKYVAAADIMVDKTQAKVYNAYIDEGGDLTLNMCLYRASEGFYKIKKGETVLIITTNKDLTFETKSGITSGSMLGGLTNALHIVQAKEGVTRAYLDWEAGADKSIYGWVNSTAGTGWQKITTGNTFPQGTMYILAAEPEEAAARLNVRWLDENGNVEEETTGIESIFCEGAVQTGEIYNLQGVRVNGAQKGIYIQNGKKYIVK